MSHVNAITGFLVDGLMQALGRPWPALVAAALATSVLLLILIRWTSSPAAVRRARDRLTARVLELVLFRHDMLVSFTAVGRILAANASYFRTLLRPLALTAVPGLLILAQLACWFDGRPLRVGEAALVEAKFRDGFAVGEREVALRGSEIVQIETEGVRIPRRSEVAWRLRAACEGVSAIEILVDGEAPVRKQVVVGEALRKISRRKNGPGAWEQFLYPAEPSIDGDHSVCQVDLRYPARELYLGDWEIDWLAAFVILTMVFGLVLKRPLGVQL